MKLWMCRDNHKVFSNYAFFTTNNVHLAKDLGWISDDEKKKFLFELDPKIFSHFSNIRLKPGKGPVQVKITVERVSK